MTNKTTRGPLRWLRGDMHNHCEDHDLVAEYLAGASDTLDFIALTNHAQKPVFFEQHRMIEQARRILPEFPIFFGLEWNAPGRGHAGLVFPIGEPEAENAYAFAAAHDRLGAAAPGGVEAVLEHLSALPAAERPVLFFNHPAAGQWSAESINRYLAADGGPHREVGKLAQERGEATGLVVGIEALHGHQAYAKVAAMDPCAYPGGAVGGLVDQVYACQRPFSLLLNSDFHVHKQLQQPDYPLGVFNHTRVGVEAGHQSTSEAILAGLRRGRTCASQGHWLDLIDFSVDNHVIGDTWTGGAGVLRVAFEATEAVEKAELIGQWQPNAAPAVLGCLGPRPAGRSEWTLEIPPDAQGFVRLRIIAESRARPAPGPPAPKHFLTSAIFLDAGRSL